MVLIMENLECSLLEESLESTHGKVLGSDVGTKLGATDGKIIGIIRRIIYVFTLGIDFRPNLISLDVPFDGSN